MKEDRKKERKRREACSYSPQPFVALGEGLVQFGGDPEGVKLQRMMPVQWVAPQQKRSDAHVKDPGVYVTAQWIVETLKTQHVLNTVSLLENGGWHCT